MNVSDFMPPQTVDEAVKRIESLFAVVANAKGASDGENPFMVVNLGVYSANGKPRDGQKENLILSWYAACLEAAIKTPLNRIAWREKPVLRDEVDGYTIVSRQAMS